MRASWLETIHAEVEQLNDTVIHLQSLAQSFKATGNAYMADRLSYLADNIAESNRSIGNAISTMLTDEVRRGGKQIAEVFAAVLANGEGRR